MELNQRVGVKSLKLGIGVVGVALISSTTFGATSYVKNEVLVRYKDGANRSKLQMSGIRAELGIQKVQRYSGTFGSFEKVTLDGSISVEEAVKSLQASGMVEYAQPNYLVHTMKSELAVSTKQAVKSEFFQPLNLLGGWPIDPPKSKDPEVLPPPAEGPVVADPRESELYGMNLIGAQKARAMVQNNSSKTVIVGVIDTGIDYNHEDLSFNVARSTDKNGKVMVGYDFANNDALPFDDNGHGTHTSGTVAGVGYNGVGVIGVAPRAKVMGLKFLTGQGSGSTGDAISAIEYAVKAGVRILSNSWGGEGPVVEKDALSDAIKEAAKADVLFVAAAGNSSLDNDGSKRGYPASYKIDNIISVAATDDKDQLASFSNYGKTTVHLAAPGVKVLSSIPGGGYKAYSGTSMATPHVAGAAALLLTANPKLSAVQLKKILLSSVDKVEGLADKTITGGRLNVAKAMQMALNMKRR